MQHIDLLEKGVNYVLYQDVLQQLEIGAKLSQVYYVQTRDYRSRIKLPTQYNVKYNTIAALRFVSKYKKSHVLPTRDPPDFGTNLIDSALEINLIFLFVGTLNTKTGRTREEIWNWIALNTGERVKLGNKTTIECLAWSGLTLAATGMGFTSLEFC